MTSRHNCQVDVPTSFTNRRRVATTRWTIFCQIIAAAFLGLGNVLRCVGASDGSDNNNGRRYNHVSGEGIYDPTNPLWREEYQYTGERRGPLLQKDDRVGGGKWEDRPQRPRIQGRKSITTDASSTSSGGDFVDEGSLERHFPYHQSDDFSSHGGRRLELRPSDGFSRGGDSLAPSSSSVSTMPSNRRGQLDWLLDDDFLQSSCTSSIRMTRQRKSNRRNKGLSIVFQPKRGTVEVDFIGPSQESRLNKIPHRPEQPIGGASKVRDGITTRSIAANATIDESNGKNETIATASTTTTIIPSVGVRRIAGRQLVPVTQLSHSPNLPSKDFQLSLSVDPFSTARLIHTLAVTCISLVSALAGTLRLVAPMIAAKRFITTIGYIFYDHYNGRYIRTTYTRRMRRMQEYEIIAGLRGTGRCILQILSVGLVGGIVGFVMDRAPCLIRPAWICHWWYGTIWITSIHTAGWAMELWLVSLNKSHPLSLRPTPTIGRSGAIRKKADRRMSSLFHRQKEEFQTSTLEGLIQIPWRIVLRRLRDPEEWFMSMLRPRSNSRFYYSNMNTYTQQHEEHKPLRLDSLLFPCTWVPLQVWTCLVVVRAIRLTLTKPLSWTDAADYMIFMSSKRWVVMRSFLGYEVLYGEWKRVFVTERRVALGAFVSTLSLTALLWTIYSVAMVDGITALLLIPTVIARLVSTWMNILLYYDRCGLPSAFGRSPVPSERKVLE
jgi:tryptophan-rich sensory protein